MYIKSAYWKYKSEAHLRKSINKNGKLVLDKKVKKDRPIKFAHTIFIL